MDPEGPRSKEMPFIVDRTTRLATVAVLLLSVVLGYTWPHGHQIPHGFQYAAAGQGVPSLLGQRSRLPLPETCSS